MNRFDMSNWHPRNQLAKRNSRRLRAASLGLTPTRLTFRDLVVESWRSVSRNYSRSLLTAIGTLLGCAAFVATLGITGTASNQVSAAFDVRRATEVTVVADTAAGSKEESVQQADTWFSPSAVTEIRNLSGVEHAGRIMSASAIDVNRFFVEQSQPVPVEMYAMDEGALAAVAPHLLKGRPFDSGHEARADAVIMLSKAVAQKIGVTQTGAAVFINDLGYTVIGIYSDTERIPALAGGAIIPVSSFQKNAVSGDQVPKRQILIETVAGAAAQVGEQVPYAVTPNNPKLLQIAAPPDPKTLRQEIEGSVTQLSLMVSLITLAIGAVSIANATAASVVLRTPEIGLRRALGARRGDIFMQLLGETVALGTFGGLIGSALGLITTIVVSAINRWVPVLDPVTLLLSVAAGTTAGVLAGAWPAAKATTVSPAQALAR
ncbi:ABC transporter permease [Paenarthrobacter sp. NPDC089316]|uniref:ABC transporter permease n=1 Tax=unclassified Paenarthrobacter TaxID=2634190 RepID=UPI00343372E9